MPRPIPTDSIFFFSQWERLCSASVFLGEEDELLLLSDQKEFLMVENENGLVSRIEVGLITASVSENPFAVKLVNSLGKLKKDDPVTFLQLFLGDGKEKELSSAIEEASFWEKSVLSMYDGPNNS